MGLFRRTESRSVSFQDVWGRGDDWAPVGRYTVTDALRLSAVIACVNLRANYVAQVPWDAYRLTNGRLRKLDVQPSIVDRPGGVMPRSQWLRQMEVSRMLWGNAFGRKVGADQIVWLDPSEVKVVEDVVGRPLRIDYRGQPINPDSLFIVPGMPLPGRRTGIAPLEQSGLVELARLAQEFGRDWFRSGAAPSGILLSPHELTKEQAEAIRDRVAAAWRNRKLGVLGSGLSYESVPVDANESQFLATMRQVQVDVCQVFGVPVEKIGASTPGASLTYANREQRTQDFLNDTMNADFVLIQELWSSLIVRGQYVRANTGALLRSDLGGRYGAYTQALDPDTGWMTVDEVRDLEDLDPLPEQSDASGDTSGDTRSLTVAEAVQKVYLGVGKVITSDEARAIVNESGGDLPVPGPSFDDGAPTTEINE